MRCLPMHKLALAHGSCLHDWHAEIVAIRAFNHFLIEECRRLTNSETSHSDVIRFRPFPERTESDHQIFTVRDNVKIYMFCSEAPCGDATMELTMRAQEDASPWLSESRCLTDGMPQSGRGHFSELGVVRRKPARADAPLTASKSCSDKLALKQCTSLLSSVASLLVHPGKAYLDELILPCNQIVPEAIDRAFSSHGRMKALQSTNSHLATWDGGYAFKPFQVSGHTMDFEFAKPIPRSNVIAKSSNITAVWTPHISEVLIGGTVQGHKQFSNKGASSISRLRIWESAANVTDGFGFSSVCQAFGAEKVYKRLKETTLLESRRAVKHYIQQEILGCWPKNSGDDQFCRDSQSLSMTA